MKQRSKNLYYVENLDKRLLRRPSPPRPPVLFANFLRSFMCFSWPQPNARSHVFRSPSNDPCLRNFPQVWIAAGLIIREMNIRASLSSSLRHHPGTGLKPSAPALRKSLWSRRRGDSPLLLICWDCSRAALRRAALFSLQTTHRKKFKMPKCLSESFSFRHNVMRGFLGDEFVTSMVSLLSRRTQWLHKWHNQGNSRFIQLLGATD